MTQTQKIPELEEDCNFYFWLGMDGGPMKSVTKEEFDALVEDERQKQDDWLNVRYKSE